MSRERITATGDDAVQFGDIRETMSENMHGEISNAEVLRRLMSTWDRHHTSGLSGR